MELAGASARQHRLVSRPERRSSPQSRREHLSSPACSRTRLSHLNKVKDYIKETAKPFIRADAIGATTASHALVVGSYRSTELREARLWSSLWPPTAYSYRGGGIKPRLRHRRHSLPRIQRRVVPLD